MLSEGVPSMACGPRADGRSCTDGPSCTDDPSRGDGRSRAVLVGVALAVVAAGLVVARFGASPWGDPAGDALYAVLVYVLVLLAAPRVGPVRAAVVATAVCAGVELLQLTGLPAAVVDRVPAARYVLGTTFAAIDLVVYAAAAAAAALTDRTVRRAHRASSAAP